MPIKMTPNVKTPAATNVAMTDLYPTPSHTGSTSNPARFKWPKTYEEKKIFRKKTFYILLSLAIIGGVITLLVIISIRRPTQKPEEASLKRLPKGIDVFEAPDENLWRDGQKIDGVEEQYLALATADAQLYKAARDHTIWTDKRVKPVIEHMGLNNVFGAPGSGYGYVRCDWPRKEKHGAKRIGDALFREDHLKGESFVFFWNKTLRVCYVMTGKMLQIQKEKGGKDLDWLKKDGEEKTVNVEGDDQKMDGDKDK
ncbi:hypothetical protein BJ508DRAFT_305592 [Ascobolus immersus RN42]|uniref:Uncharacterized protein n=1 Tax=Ascobolus immersus RN42 TaxID=1160509 RepID=A0A3N4I8Q6_ASCIM|nr:hypothetical protein BJ508DRAFT_305592 [Ascobolus immersus RN42]